MSDVSSPTIASARSLSMKAEDLRQLGMYSGPYERKLRRLQRAHLDSDKHAVKSVIHEVLNSFGAKVCAATRTFKSPPSAQPPTLAQIKALAESLNPTRAIPESVTVWSVPKLGGGSSRALASFGWKRRALQLLCADILSVRYPASSFDYLVKGKGGTKAALLALHTIIEEGKYQFVVTMDVANCFGSAIKKKVGELLPLPKSVVNNVLLVEDEVAVVAKPNGETNTAPLCQVHSTATDHVEDDGDAVRQGLPPGSSASGIIMYRAVIGPMLATLPFANRIVLYGDDLAVPVKDLSEGEEVQNLIKSLYATSPVGPLTIGRGTISHMMRGFDFLGYRTIRKPECWGGRIHCRPSYRSYRKFELTAAAVYRDAGGGMAGLKQAVLYQKRWMASYPLWKPNHLSKLYLWYTLQAGSWHQGPNA